MPQCSTEHCIRIYQPAPFVMSYSSEELYYPNECIGPKPKACHPGVKYDKRQLPCLHGLINGDSDQQMECPVTIYKRKPPPQPVKMVVRNRYLVTTENITYHYRCPRKTPKTGKLTAGNYIIEVEPTCIVDTMSWMLQGIPVLNIKYNHTVVPPNPINLTWLKVDDLLLRNHTDVMPIGVRELTLPNYEAIQVPPSTSINSDIEKIQSNLGRTHWLIWCLLGLSISIGIVVLGGYLKLKLCPHANCATRVRKDVNSLTVTEEEIHPANDMALQVDLLETEQ